MGTIELPGFSGVMDALNSLLASSLISNYIFWFLGIALVGYTLHTLISSFRK